jgi:hypothetical protein
MAKSLEDYAKIGADVLEGNAPEPTPSPLDKYRTTGETIIAAPPPTVMALPPPPPDAGASLRAASGGGPDVDPYGRVMADPELGTAGGRRAVQAGQEIIPSAIQGFRRVDQAGKDTSIQTPYLRDVFNQGPLGRYVYNPLLDVVGSMGGAVGSAIGQTAYTVGTALDPSLGRDLYMGNQVVGALLPQVAGPRAGLMPPQAPDVNALRPRTVQERMAPPPIEGQSTLGRINALLRHDEQWNNPENPTLAPPDARFLPPGDAPPAPPPDFIPPSGGRGGPRATGAPAGAVPTGLTPEQVAELQNIPKDVPPMKNEIITQADAEARADQIIRHFGSMGNTEPIPGAVGGLPTITGNGGLATLYRAVRDKEPVNPFLNQETALKKATGDSLKTMAGTEDDLKAAVKNRTDITEPMYRQAWANKTAADPSGAIQTVEDLMKSPLKQNDTAMAELENIHKKLQGQTDPEQLKGITDHIDETIARLKPEGKADRRTLGALDQVDKAITAEISRTTPGFDTAQATFANLSRRIDEMKYFQSRKLTDLQGQPTLGNIRSTLDDIAKKQAGDKFHPADSVTPENLQTLKQLHDQAQREAFTASAGKSLGGSNTFQNLATDSVLRTVGKQVGANLLGTGGGYLTDLAAGGGGVTGAVIGNLTGNALQGYATVRASQAAARQAAGQQMLMQALRERLMNIDNKGIEALRRAPP